MIRNWLIAAFIGITLISLGGYFGFIKISYPENFNKKLLGQISGSADDFKFIGKVNLDANNLNTEKNEEVGVKPKTAKNKSVKEKITGSNQPVAKAIIPLVVVATATINKAPLVVESNTLNIINNVATSVENKLIIQEPVQEQIKEQNIVSENQPANQPENIQENIPVNPPVNQTAQAGQTIPTSQANVINHLFVSEIMAGIDGNASYEFIEFFNPTANPIDLTGWSIKKKSSSGSELILVSSGRFEGKIIPANKYFLLANEGGYNGAIAPDISWPKSYALAYNNNSIIIYNSNGGIVEEVNWTEIPKDQSIERESFESNRFRIRTNPSPQNSQSN